MYCTNCGAQEQTSKTYCRQCGKWIGSSSPEERLTVMIVFNALSAVFGAAAALALFMTYLGTSGAKWSIYVAGTFCLIISVYQSLSFVFALDMKRRLKDGRVRGTSIPETTQSPKELPPADTSQIIKVPSVTEHTTELLERKS